MEFQKKEDLQNVSNTESGISFRDIIERYLSFWKWFLLSSLLSLIFAYYSLNFKRPIYEASSVIKIENVQGGESNGLSAFQDLGVMSSSSQNVEDEMEIIKSEDLISQVIKTLNLNVSYFSDKNYLSKFLDDNLSFSTEFYENEQYDKPSLEINFLINDSILYKTNSQFIISVKSSNYFIFKDIETKIENRYDFGKKFTTDFGDIIITPNADLKIEDLIGSNFLVAISSIKELSSAYAKKLVIEPKSQYSSIVNLKLTSGSKQKAEDFLNELINKYNERAISLKEELSKSTSDFVSDRLEKISNELSNVDLTAENIKTRYQMSDAASETGLNMQSGQVIESQIVQANMQLKQIESVKDFVSTKANDELIPIDVGVNDNSVSTTMQQYNQILMQKKKFLENSTDKNPIVVNLNEQLKTLRSNIDQGLNNLQSSKQISINALNQQDARINSKLYNAPRQERQIRDIQRQQQIKEQLYLYLLQKREETALTLGVADPNAQIIDSPRSGLDSVAPKIKTTYLGFLIVGLLLPIVFIYLSEMLDTKIHSREDVEKLLNIPILGDIPKYESKDRYLVKQDDHSGIAEAFRILRTNLNFVVPDSENNLAKTIFVTSTIAHEGKSFVTSNLATVLAHAGKKTLLLGLDIRAPKIKNYLGVRGKIGVTNYIADSKINPSDLIIEVPNNENLTIISSGDLSPNPSELLTNPRLNELFDYCKANYDYIIVDTPAYSMVTDTLLIANHADTFIYLIRANFLDKRTLNYVNSVFKEKRLPNMVLLINGVDSKRSYGYGYGYGSHFDKSKKKWWQFT